MTASDEMARQRQDEPMGQVSIRLPLGMIREIEDDVETYNAGKLNGERLHTLSSMVRFHINAQKHPELAQRGPQP